MHPSARYSWSLEWSLRRPVQHTRYIPQSGAPLLLDTRFADASLLEVLAEHASVWAYGPFWLATVTERPEPLVAHRLVRTEPVFWQRYLVNAHDPFYAIEPDPFGTWELRHHFAQTPNPPPSGEPGDAVQLKVAHNLAVASGHAERADEWLTRLADRLHPIDRGHAAGLQLLGYEWLPGVAPRLRVFVRAAGPTQRPWRVEVTSIVHRRPWSTVPVPEAVRQVGMPFALPSTLWRPGFVYASESEIRQQPGVEEYRMQLVGPSRRAGELVPLFTLR